jgi:subtilisin family serine protease
MSEPLEINLDLDKLFQPAWATAPTDPNKYSRYEGNEGEQRGDRRRGPGDFRGPRPGGPGGPRPGGPGGFGRDDRRGGPRPPGNRGPFGPRPGGPGGPRPGGPGGPGGDNLKWDPTRPPRRDDRGPRGRRPEFRPEPLIPVDVQITPEPVGVASLGRQIKLSGRAYPLFDVANLVIQKPDRYSVTFSVIHRRDPQPRDDQGPGDQPAEPPARPPRGDRGDVLQRLFVCSLDDSLWLSEGEAAKHALKAHFDTFYQTEKTPCDPPKGVWTLVAQCGISGELLGPPNFHGYQEKLRKLHADRFNRMPFDVYKSRVKIVKDEAVVKQWIESVSFKFEYNTLNVAEPRKLGSMEEVNTHFREVHQPNLIKEVTQFTPKADAKLPGPLQTLLRVTLDKERRFPIKTATALSGAFASQGLQFFKRDKTVVHVAVARPHYLDLDASVVSETARKIITFINDHTGCNRKQLVESLAPTPAPAEPITPPDPAAPPVPPTLTPEQQAVLNDLHWLIHQGNVIEFASGLLEAAKKPVVKPAVEAKPKPEAKPKEARFPVPAEAARWLIVVPAKDAIPATAAVSSTGMVDREAALATWFRAQLVAPKAEGEAQPAAVPTEPAFRVFPAAGVVVVDPSLLAPAVVEGLRKSAAVFENNAVPAAPPVFRKPADAMPSPVAHLAQIGIDAARARNLTGAGTVIGVLDSGIDATHPEFVGRTIHFAEFDPTGAPVSGAARDAADHGTHVCGLIAGANAGVAPGATLAVAAVLTLKNQRDQSYGTVAQVIAGLDWLIRSDFGGNTVGVINASLATEGYNEFLYGLALEARIRNALFVAAIGNSGRRGENRHGSPANYDIVLGVGGVDAASAPAGFSDWGKSTDVLKPDLSAPGVDLVSAASGGKYLVLSGTSMASPLVAGAAALALEADASLRTNTDALIGRLKSTARPFADTVPAGRGGSGVLDLTRLLA